VSAKRLLRRPEVEVRVGLRASAIYEKMSRGRFPKPVKLGDRAVAWLETEIDDWISRRLGERDRA
jgi:prophage regulatory protein